MTKFERERARRVEHALVRVAGSPETQARYPTVAAAWSAYSKLQAAKRSAGGAVERWRAATQVLAANPLPAVRHARELDGTAFGGDSDGSIAAAVSTSASLADAVYRGKNATLLAVAMLEWRSRLEVVRLATELGAARLRASDPVPSSLANLVERVGDPQRLALIPDALESALLDWGGFFKQDGSEFEVAAQRTSMRLEDFLAALGVVDELFPLPGGETWWRTVEGLSWLSLVPFPVQGLGALTRDATLPGWEDNISSVAKRYVSIRRASVEAYL